MLPEMRIELFHIYLDGDHYKMRLPKISGVFYKAKLGNIYEIDEGKRTHLVFETHFESHDFILGEALKPVKVYARGIFYRNLDKNILKSEDLYECVVATFKEIARFLSSNIDHFGILELQIPSFEELKGELEAFLHSYRNLS
jgi:hypothetical protein